MVLLDQHAFLTQLTKILEKSRSAGTIYVTFKRNVPGVKTAATATPEQLANTGCLVRAVGAKQKISCMITAKEHRGFMQSYGNILKVSLDSLKKREKKKELQKQMSVKNTKKGAGGSSSKAGPVALS